MRTFKLQHHRYFLSMNCFSRGFLRTFRDRNCLHSDNHRPSAHGVMNCNFKLITSLSSRKNRETFYSPDIGVICSYKSVLYFISSPASVCVWPDWLYILFRSQAFCSFFFRHFLTDARCVALKKLFYSFIVSSWVVVSGPAADKSDVDWRSVESI